MTTTILIAIVIINIVYFCFGYWLGGYSADKEFVPKVRHRNVYINVEGTYLPAPDGELELKDGTKIIVA